MDHMDGAESRQFFSRKKESLTNVFGSHSLRFLCPALQLAEHINSAARRSQMQ